MFSLASLLAASAAQAGTYTVAYSGGMVTIPPSESGPYFYDSNASEYTGFGTAFINPDAQGNPVPLNAGAAGTLTATFTWQPAYPGEPPPAEVIVEQTCTASAGYSQPNNTALSSCDDGLGQSAGPTAGPISCTGTTHTVQSPASDGSVLVTCSPSAKLSGSSGTQGAGGPFIVDYSASISPVTVNLTGGIGLSPTKRLLIGQQLQATLSTGPLTPTSWAWSASGGNPFKNYTTNDSVAIYTPLGSETGSQLTCNFAQPATMASVSCTAHLAVPVGASPAAGLDVTATQALTIDKPSAQLDVFVGTVTDLPTSTNPTDVQLQQVYTYPPTGYAEGLSWDGTITTPSDYVTSGDYGSWNWTQLITAARQQKNNGVYWQFAVDTTTPPTIINGTSVLDGNYPYGYFTYPSDGTRTGNADSPLQPLDGSTAIREYDVSDSFNDYLMYIPPGSGSLPVPLKLSSWYWDFQATKDASNAWSTSGMNAQWGFVSDFPAFPTWTFCAAIGHLVYVAP